MIIIIISIATGNMTLDVKLRKIGSAEIHLKLFYTIFGRLNLFSLYVVERLCILRRYFVERMLFLFFFLCAKWKKNNCAGLERPRPLVEYTPVSLNCTRLNDMRN